MKHKPAEEMADPLTKGGMGLGKNIPKYMLCIFIPVCFILILSVNNRCMLF